MRHGASTAVRRGGARLSRAASGKPGRVYLERVHLRYCWRRQVILACNARGEVLAAAKLARLIVGAKRPRSLVPKGKDVTGRVAERSNHEIDAVRATALSRIAGLRDGVCAALEDLREAVVADAHLRGLPAPRSWTGPLHGKDVNTSQVCRVR